MSLEKTQHELEATAVQVAGIAVELNAVAKDLGGDKEALRLRAIGLQAEAGRLALAALGAARAGEQIACAARGRKRQWLRDEGGSGRWDCASSRALDSTSGYYSRIGGCLTTGARLVAPSVRLARFSARAQCSPLCVRSISSAPLSLVSRKS